MPSGVLLTSSDMRAASKNLRLMGVRRSGVKGPWHYDNPATAIFCWRCALAQRPLIIEYKP